MRVNPGIVKRETGRMKQRGRRMLQTLLVKREKERDKERQRQRQTETETETDRDRELLQR